MLATPSATLDRTAVREVHDVCAMDIPANLTGQVVKRLRPFLRNLPRSPNVVPTGDNKSKRVLLAQSLDGTFAPLPDAEREWLQSLLDAGSIVRSRQVVELEYEHFTVEETLRKLIPEGIEGAGSFEHAGHVVHLNLKDEALPWKHLIAEVVLDKVQRCETVVNKIEQISTVYRTYPLEVLAGRDSTQVKLREADCNFELDLREVYWNSRLQVEHNRLIETMPSEAIVADATCGVGPFSVPLAAKRGVKVFANDLNPAAMRWLKVNADRNKCGSLLVAGEPECARVFLRRLVAEGVLLSHALFNLPASGLELLDAFRGLDINAQILVHCYCFAAGSRGKQAPNARDVVDDILTRASAALDATLPPAANGGLPFGSPDVLAAVAAADAGQTVVRWVRNVAPNKDMYCLSFHVPRLCAASRPTVADDDESQTTKRPRLEQEA